MAKLPYMQFYVADFMMDVQTLDMQIRGAWITLLCLLWRTEDGTIKLTLSELANLWQCDTVSAQDDIDTMIASNLFDHDFIAEREQYVIKSRRIQRDRKRLGYRAKWMREHRVNSPCTGREQSVDPKIQNQIQIQNHKQIRDSRPNLHLEEFEKFWEAYPRKTGKGAAKKSWLKAVGQVEGRIIIDAVYKQRKGFNYEDNKKYIPMPATWLNQERWLDEARNAPLPESLTTSPAEIELKKRQLWDIAQREWDRMHPIDQLEPDDVPF